MEAHLKKRDSQGLPMKLRPWNTQREDASECAPPREMSPRFGNQDRDEKAVRKDFLTTDGRISRIGTIRSATRPSREILPSVVK